MSKAFAEANARKKKQQQQQDMTKEQRYEQTFVDAVNSRARERDNAVRSVQNLSQQIADNDRTGAYKGTLTDQHRRVNDLSSLRTQLQNLRRNFGLDIGDTSDIDNAIKQQTKFVNAFKNDGEYRTGYWFGEKYKGSNKQQVQSAISSLEKGNDAQKGEALWLKQNQYQYWNSADLQKQMEANLAEAKRLQSLVNEVHGNAKSNRMKQYGGKIDSLKAEANAIRRTLEAKAKEKEIMKLAPSEREMLTKYGEAAAKEDAYMSVSSANPVSRLIANASLPKETKKVIEDTEKMLRKKGYTPEQIRTLRDYSVKDYNAKSVQAQAEAIQKFADKNGWTKLLASAGAIAADYVGGVQGVSDVIGQNLFGGKDAFTGNKRSVDYNSMFQQTGLAGEALKAGVTQDMGEFGKWAYGAGLSTIESLIGAYGMPGKTYELLMSGMAAQSAMQEMHRRGVDDGRVLGVGLAAGGLEALFEHASIENLRGIINAQKATGSGIKGAIERGLLQAGVEASEEGFTSLANTATELLALGDKSELKSNIKLYQQQGMSEEEATRKAGMEWLDSVLQDTAAGFASGGASTVIPSIGFAVNEARAGQAVIDKTGETDLIKEALSFGESSPAYKAAQALKDQLAEGQKNKTDVKLSKSKLGELYRKVEEQKREDAQSERAQIERQLPQTHESLFVNENGDVTVGVQASRVAEALIASGESASVAVAKAPVIEKIVAGKEVTDAELKKMGVFSAAVAKVVNTYTQSDIDPNNATESELIKAYHAAAAQQKTRIDAVVKMGEQIKEARTKLEAAQAEEQARLAQEEANLDEETQAAVADLEQSAPEQEQQSSSVIKVTNGDGTQVDMTLQDYIDSARQVNPDDPRSDAELAEEFNTLLGHAAMNGGTVRAEDVPNILRGASEASVAAEETPATEEEETTAEEEEEPAAEEGTGEEETKPKEEPAAEEPEAPVEDAPKEKRPLGEEIAKDIYFLQEEGNEVKELTEEQIWAMQIAMPLLRQAGIKNLVVDEAATNGANAFIDDGDGTIRINPKQMKSQIVILRILAHEIVHPATNDRNGKQTDMAERIIDSFVAMYKQGVLTGKLEKLVEAYINGKAVPDYKDDYKEFTGHDVSDHYAKQEIASDMVGLVGDSRPMLEKLVGYQPDLMTKILRKLNTRRNGITIRTIKDDDQRKATQQALDQIATDINNALRKSKLAAFQPKTKAQERADQRAEKLAAKAQKQNADRVSRVKERARTADTGESVAESASPENKSVAKAMARLNKGANRTRTARASLGLFPKDSNEHRAIEALGPGAEVTTNGDDELVLAKSKDNHTIMYSHATLYGIGDYYEAHPEAKSGIELLKQTLKANGHTDTEIAEVVKGIESLDKELGDLSEQIYQKYGWDEMKEHYAMEIVTDLRDAQQVIYTLTPNGEYPVNLDLALVCKKRVAYTRVLAQLVRDGVLDEISFGSKAIARVNQILRDAGFETACLGCFVEARRTAIQKWAEDFIYEWNKVVSEHDPNAGYFNFTYTNNPETGERENEIPALSVKDVAALDRMYEFNLLNDQGNVSLSSSGPLDKVIELFNEKKETGALLLKLRPADLMTPEGITALKKTDKTLFNLAKARYGATQPKVLQEFHPYASDMTNATFEEVAKKTGKSFSGTAKYREAAEGLLKRKRDESDEDFEIRMRELGVANLLDDADRERRIDALAMRLYLYDIGGARIQSFSDFMIENTLDYLQIIADMSAARLPMHGYTKEIIAMKLFGMTGLKWNGSLIAHVDPAEDKNHAGLLPVSEASDGRGIVLTGPARVENGEIIGEKQWAICFDDYDRNVRTGKPAKDYLAAHGGVVKNLTEAQKREYNRLKQQESYIQSIGMKDIFALMMDPRYSKNIGNITIGVSDVQIIAMLRSDLFTMVIPYHKSGLPKIFAELMGIDNYNDYEEFQKTTVKQVYDKNKKPISEFIRIGGKPVHANTEAFNFNEALQNRKGDARAAANDYIKWCAQMHKIVDSDGNTLGYETFNPKFSNSPNGYNFTKELNYYKLLEDFTALDPVTGEWTPQGPVQQYEMNEDATYDLSKPLLPSESNRLTDKQKEQYRERLRGIGIYTEAEIDKIIQKSDMTFGELVRTEAENRGRYHQTVDPKFDDTYEEILEALFDPELRSTRAERDAERQKGIEKKAADKAKKAEAKRAALDAEYFDAIDRGDTEEALRMLYAAAKKAGYKLEVYHGTNVEFTEFREYGGNEPGYHVGTRKAAEDRVQYELNPRVMKLYAKLGNKIDMPDVFGLWHGVYDYVQFAKGYDSDMVDQDLFLTKKKKANKTDQKNADLFVENEEYAAMKAAVEAAVNSGYKRSLIKHAVEAQRNYLISVGVDTVQYKNAYEGKGSKSYMLLHANQVKSADLVTYGKDGNRIPLSQRFNSGTNDLRYSIAGENSILADTDELDVAKNMEAAGNNADQIRIVTGWYRGPDGKWRYEIDDSRMQFHEKGSAKIWNDYPDYKDFYELEQKVKRGDTLTAEEQAWFDKAKKKFEPLREKLNKEGRDHIRNGTATLDEVLVHPELFAAYPDLRKIKFRVTDMTGWSKKGILFGQHDPAKKLITLNKKAPWTTKAQAKERAAKKAAEREERQKLGLPIEPVSPFADPAVQTMRSTLLHEVQHAIQSIEGFARGTSPEYWEFYLGERDKMDKAYEQLLRNVSPYDVAPKLKAWRRAYYDANINEMARIEDEVSDAADDPSNKKVTAEAKDYFFGAINAIKLNHDARGDFELYQDTVGEREARDVQQRINLTPAQRRRYHPDLGYRPVHAAGWSGIYQPGPNNKTWNKPSGTKARYSLPSDALEMDRQYMAAVENGNIRTTNQIIREAAVEWGAATDENGKPIKLYRGTNNFGRTEFQTRLIYGTTNQSVAAGYGGPGEGNTRGLSKSRTIKSAQDYRPDNGDLNQLIRNANAILGSDLHIMNDEEVNRKRKEMLDQVSRLADEINEVWVYGDDFNPPESIRNDLEYVLMIFGDIVENDELYFSDNPEERENWVNQFNSLYSNVLERFNRVYDYYTENRKALLSSSVAPLFRRAISDYEVSDTLIDIMYVYARLMQTGAKVANSEGNPVDIDKIREAVEWNKDSGIYSMYGNLGDKPLSIDAEGAHWSHVKADAWDGNHHLTDEIAKWAQENGYTSVVIKNIMDPGVVNAVGDDYIFFDRNQVKSADPVTYDDDGNVIPPSERFRADRTGEDEWKNRDIRFSLNPDLFLTDDYKTYYQELFSDKGLSPEAVKKARANARDENISRIATTYKNFFDANERRRKGLRKGDLGYVPDTNAESMQRAQDRLDADFQGEYENLKKNGLNTDDDVDAAMGILNVLVTDARNTKDYKDVADWLQKTIRTSATRVGQTVQAFAKYAQTPEGILVDAAEILAETDLSKADQGIILAQLAQFATTLNAIKKGEEGNRDDLIDLILDQAAIRNTKVSNQTLKDLYRQKIDFLYDAALNQMSQIAQDYLKPSLAKGAATYQTISHLFNVRTAARNVVSNTVFSPVAAVANNLAVVPDIIISLFTKQKTVGFDRWWFSGKTWKGVEEGARRAHVEIALDIDPRPNSRDKYGTSRRTWKMTGNAASRVGSTIEKAMGFELNWTDEFHKGAVEAEILQSLQGLVDKGVIREEDAEEWARQEALYRSFQDDTFLSARLQDIKNLLNTVGFGHTGRYLGAKAQTPFNEIKEFGLGDLIQKYTQVPGALITRAIEFSPIGYVKMIANLAQMKNVNKALRTAEMRLQEAQDELDQEPDSSALINRVFQAQKSVDSARFKAQSKQRMAALAMGRATTGVGLIKAFAMLAASGLLHRPDDDDDPDATAMLQSMGVTGTQLNVSALARKLKGEDVSWKKGDQLWAIDFLEPLNGLMTIGTKIVKEAKDDKTFKDKLDSAQRGTLDGLWNVIGEIPTMQSFSTIQQTLRYYDPEQWPNRATAVGIELARGSVTGFIPSLIRQTAQATDTVQRNTYTSKKPLEMTKDQIQNTLPYFRNKLPAKLDNYGQPRRQENPLLNALNAYVIPGSIRTYQVSPEAKELASVSKKTGDVNIYPDRNPPSKITVSVDGEDYSYNLSAKQKQTYQATRGKYSYQFQHDMMSDPFYKSATAQEKNAMLTEAKQLADYMAKKEFLSKQKDAPDYTDSSHEKTLGALANGYTVASWVDVRTTTNKAKGVDADGDGKADSGTKKKEQLGIIQSYNLNDTQKTYWFRGSDYNGSDSGRDYIGEAIDQHITPTKYIDAALKLLDAHGTDNNNDGKTDSGSVLKSKAAIINSLALTAEQKKWLFLQGNSKSTKFANSYNWTDTSGN